MLCLYPTPRPWFVGRPFVSLLYASKRADVPVLEGSGGGVESTISDPSDFLWVCDDADLEYLAAIGRFGN